MKYMTGKEIRESFLQYFESKGHKRVPSSPLVPYNDASLLFTNAGMVQFKDVFLGMDKRDYTRATTAQRCLRAGGKHNDLDTVGRTARHHTFFEMMGNFSFGDYFKRDAITFAWEYLTTVLEMPKDKLYVTVYEEDDEAAALWQEITGMDPERIFRIGAKDNFWAMGDTGPCGPCSEIFFDRGEQYGCDAPECGIGKCDCDRWMEIWNLVFMQFNRDADGNLTPLPRPSIDTGMGLERVASILQHVDSNYDTDIMRDIIHGVEELCGQPYHGDHRGFPFRVIADHARACSFMIADGIIPSNEGRGYVLRRILRRAARFGLVLGMDEPFLYKVFPYVKASLADHYPELIREEENIVRAIKMEEERFHQTLKAGMNITKGIVERMKKAGQTEISGDDLFTLYDTFGFPLDLAKDIAEENGFTLDEKGFEAAMDAQRKKSQSAKSDQDQEEQYIHLSQVLAHVPAGVFTGYQQFSGQGKIIALVVNGEEVEEAQGNAEGWLALDSTPFYGESGGQVGDVGVIGDAEILDTQKLPNGLMVHQFRLNGGKLAVGQTVEAAVDEERRMAIARHHSATHLLHRALRMTLGEQLHQAGSHVNEERLRFDFNHFEPISAEDLRKIEDEVNRQILADLPITKQEMALEDAKATGAMAFFGDKYGDVVRLISMGDFSKELCGGTHCDRTGQLGSVKIISETGIGAGMRRIEAVAGAQARALYKRQEEKLDAIAALLKTSTGDVERRLEQILAENRSLSKELEKMQAKLAADSIGEIWQKAVNINGVNALCVQVPAADMATLRSTVDMLRDKLQDYLIVAAAVTEDKVQFVVTVSEKAQKAGCHAGQIIKEVAAICDGKGGGRADMAQAGGKNTDQGKIDQALAKAEALIREKLQ